MDEIAASNNNNNARCDFLYLYFSCAVSFVLFTAICFGYLCSYNAFRSTQDLRVFICFYYPSNDDSESFFLLKTHFDQNKK